MFTILLYKMKFENNREGQHQTYFCFFFRVYKILLYSRYKHICLRYHIYVKLFRVDTFFNVTLFELLLLLLLKSHSIHFYFIFIKMFLVSSENQKFCSKVYDFVIYFKPCPYVVIDNSRFQNVGIPFTRLS